MTNYQRGAEFERRVCADLTSHGFAAFRSAGSRGVADVLGIAPGSILLVQCKRDGEISLDEWNKLWALSERLDPVAKTVVPLLALMPGRTGIEYRALGGPAAPRARRLWVRWEP